MAGVGVLPGQATALDLYHNGPASAEVQGAATGGVMQGIPPASVYPSTGTWGKSNFSSSTSPRTPHPYHVNALTIQIFRCGTSV
eukprot:583346-Pyramimonas_sp.AAC.2